MLPPPRLAPMTATAGRLPADDAGWSFEMKWDGVRALARVVDGRLELSSRSQRDITVGYPELAPLGADLGGVAALLDGEIVALDPAGRPDFGRLQPRMHVSSAEHARRLAVEAPVVYLAFDLLHLDANPLLDLPYAQRRELLDGLELAGPCWQTPPAFDGAGADALAASRERGLEGVVAKRSASRYLPGRRSPDWIKVKHLRMQEVVLGGWAPGQGRRAGTVGALLLGIPAGGALRYAGQVGTGFTDAMLADLDRRFASLATPDSPFDPPVAARDAKGARWLLPRLVGEVAFGEWTADGRMRHPTWRGLRPDKAPGDVVREP